MIQELINLPTPFRLAKLASMKSTHRVKMGATITNKGKSYSTGTNKIKTHPTFANPSLHLKVSIHAEIDCILKSKSNVNGDTIYVYREDLEGRPKLARPCKDCIKSLKEFGIKRIYYTVEHFPYWQSEAL